MTKITLILAINLVITFCAEGYIAGPSMTNWDDAQSWCQAQGSDLAVITSYDHWQSAKEECKTVASGSSWGCWIGLRQVSGQWKWIDDSPLDYGFTSSGVATKGVDPWWRDDPNGNNQCVHLWNAAAADYTYTDYLCTATTMFPLCNEPATSDPTTGPTADPTAGPTAGPIADPSPEQYIAGPMSNWYDAQIWCESQGTELATISSYDDWLSAKEVCSTTTPWPSASGCWIGLHQVAGEWEWADGSPLDYGFMNNGEPTAGIQPWHPSDPNGINDCVHLWNAGGYLYADFSCTLTTVHPLCNPPPHRQYIAGPSMKNWDGAQAWCEEQGSDLAVITSYDDWQSAKEECKTVASGSSWGCWIGLRQVSGQWKWIDDSQIDYGFTTSGAATKGVDPWWRDDPNGANQCVHLWNAAAADYTYTDYFCTQATMFPLCNKPATSDSTAKSGLLNMDIVRNIGSENSQSAQGGLYLIWLIIGLMIANFICIIIHCYNKNKRNNKGYYGVVSMESESDIECLKQ